ncbi:MurR/RpiR family transcriptional regulator [uncultured Faecalibaculum sp.]|uniref:MurR/RpiR family transcriptional regulator n=1 Tax=uncultured Faecalibaculum sp. TaxID=1729681 RepID=UPI002615DA9C|nr:MurR/RpiR family transcriptional regulator [uncultured Faecalibaculum sp.]
MQYKEKSAIPLIEAAYSGMTQTEKLIAKWFLEENEPADSSLKAMAQLLAVSEATLVRFAKKCGFKGYREFMYQYERSLNASKPDPRVNESTLQVLDAYQDLLTKSYSLIDEEQICRVAQMISDAGRVYVSGLGSSGIAAKEMASRFMRVGVGIEACSDVDTMRMLSVFRSPDDLVIGLSLSGSRKEFLEHLTVARERGAKTLLITSSSKEDLSHLADEVVLVPSLVHMNHGHFISPQFPLLVMTDILYAAYMRQNRDFKKSLHEQTLEALHKNRRETS